jgi:hypothetical protein
MKQAKWNLTSDIDFTQFSSGEQLTFVQAMHDNSSVSDGFKFFVHGLIDGQGRFHMLGHETIPTPPDQAGEETP